LLTFISVLWQNFSTASPIVADNAEELSELHSCKAFLSSFLPGCATSTRSRHGGARRGNATSVQDTMRTRAQTIVGLIPDPDVDAACLDTLIILSRFLRTLPNTHVCHVDSRSIPINDEFIHQRLQQIQDPEALDRCSVITICTTARRTTLARASRPEVKISLDDSSWELVAFVRADGNANSPWDNARRAQPQDRRWEAECYLRNIGDHSLWFKSCNTTTIQCLPAPAEDSLREAYVSWQTLIYVRTSGGYLTRNKLQYLQFTGGQGTMLCHHHELPFIVTPPVEENRPRLTCCFKDENGEFSCNRLAKWSCPSDACTASLCRLHSKQLLDNTAEDLLLVRIHPRPPNPAVPNPPIPQPQIPHDDEIHDDDPLGRLIDEQRAEEGSEGSVAGGEQMDLLLDGEFAPDDQLPEEELQDQDARDIPGTNAADIPVMVDKSSGVPGHVLLNKHYGLLNRPGVTNYITARSGAFFQRLTSRFAGASIPLLYPEGMLFPSIFWKSLADGTVVGALPHCLWTAAGECKKAGFASLSEHIRTRLTDPTLLTSTDPRAIQFYFDALFNLQLSHSDTRIVMSRGWEHLSNDPSTFQTLHTEGRIPFGDADSRKRVNELAAEIAREQPTYFYTHSCNQAQHFGVRPIFQWLENNYASASEETRDAAVQAALVPMLRAWQRAGTHLMKYIETSPEQPLGPVTKLWWRWEFQTTRGNLPHIHALVWTGEDPESLEVRSRVKSKLSHCFADRQPFVDAGLISGLSEEVRLRELASVLHEHSCHKGGYRCCKKRDRDGNLICRFPKRPASHIFSTKSIYVQHSNEALEILRQCGLAEMGLGPGGTEQLLPTAELQAKKHMYPAHPDTRFSPMNDWIFAAARSSDNLQICSPAFTARYLAKYAAGEEERARVFLRATKDENTLNMQQENLRNTKIAGAAIAAANDKSRERPSTAVEGRTLSMTEAVWWLLGFSYVHLCSHYVHVNTGFKQDRGGVIKHERQRVRPGVEADQVPGQIARQNLNFPPVRRFSLNQCLTILDCTNSCITPDAISKFSARPPELMFLNNLVDYFECTVRLTIPRGRIRAAGQALNAQEALLRFNIRDSPWIDGFDKEIKLLPNKIQRVRELAVAYRDDARHSAAERQLVALILNNILDPLLQLQPAQDLVDIFVQQGDALPRVAVLSNPLPRYADRFLVHVILSLGNFSTEVDAFTVNHLRRSFQTVGLVEDAENVTVDEVNTILRTYVLKQLLYMPGGTVSFDKHLINAHTALHSLLIEGDLQFHATPLVLRNELTAAATEALVLRKRETRRSFAEALHFLSNPIHNLPPVDDLVDATQADPLDWQPEIQRGETQTLESFQEQQRALNLGVEAIDAFRSGKSHVTAHWGAYALSKGLNTIEVLTLFQKLQPTNVDIQRIQDLIREDCEFRPNWNNIPPEALQIFGHREAEQEAVTRQLDRVRQDNAIPKSQLCVVRTLPVDEGNFSVSIAPPGRRNIPANDQEFVDQGWQDLTISKVFTIPQRLEGNMKVRREQYPVRHYIAATIHKKVCV
ncbi:hypothetical protein FOZ62_011082, partial [Perkinsus olseni]